MKNGGKTSYEIRSDLLRLAYNILVGKMDRENIVRGGVSGINCVEAPSVEDIIDEATKLNKFVSDDNRN